LDFSTKLQFIKTSFFLDFGEIIEDSKLKNFKNDQIGTTVRLLKKLTITRPGALYRSIKELDGMRTIDCRSKFAKYAYITKPPGIRCSDRYTLFLFDLCLWLSSDRSRRKM
jgi:hypothetical protein